MKRLVTIQDISCFGKCSSTVALPIISAIGIETCILPTAILSTHTGEFTDYSFLSLTDEMNKIIAHWKKEKIEFDAIYVGYIGSTDQIEIISDFIDDFSNENTIVYVDPAIADNEKLYSGLTIEYVNEIKKLCKKAHIISPNIYEAMLLVGEKCRSNYTKTDAERIIKKLADICPKSIITGIHSGENIVTFGYDKNNDSLYVKENKKIDGMFYGTGDVFSSVLIGSLINNMPFESSISLADDFVQECIINTLDNKEKYWYSINFEKCMNKLIEKTKLTGEKNEKK